MVRRQKASSRNQQRVLKKLRGDNQAKVMKVVEALQIELIKQMKEEIGNRQRMGRGPRMIRSMEIRRGVINTSSSRQEAVLVEGRIQGAGGGLLPLLHRVAIVVGDTEIEEQ